MCSTQSYKIIHAKEMMMSIYTDDFEGVFP